MYLLSEALAILSGEGVWVSYDKDVFIWRKLSITEREVYAFCEFDEV